MVWGYLLILLILIWLSPLLLYGRPLWRAWREPALRFPLLIIESDDWGPGPPRHAIALKRLADCLARYRDHTDRPACATLGLILSVPDWRRMASGGASVHQSLWLDDPLFMDHLRAIRDGRERGVLVPQLHGAAHYWPPALMRAAAEQPEVRAWLMSPASLETESLPSPLQSRWTDASRLPSVPISREAIRWAAREETDAYTRIMEEPPRVAVPPTFVWNPEVEQTWAEAGIQCLITPGRRLEGRDAAGRPTGPRASIQNGQRGRAGLVYLVRDAYFEPARGHRAERGLDALAHKTAQGRPCLLETHRLNFTGDQADDALHELDNLLSQALTRYPDLRFATCAELAEQYRQKGDWLEWGLPHRYRAWLARIRALPRFWKLARLSGLALVLSALASAKGAFTHP